MVKDAFKESICSMNLAIIGTAGIPANYGGFETLADNLVNYLSGKYNITVYCSSKSYDKKTESYKGAQLKYVNLKANGFQSVFYDTICILKAIRKSDVILLLGVSGAINIPFLKLFCNVKFVSNIDGIEWKRGKWNKFAVFFLKLSEYIAVKCSHNVIVDNIGIRKYVEKKYHRFDTHLIAYGGDNILQAKHSQPEYKYYFSVCRIEPENNVHILLDAFSRIKENIIIVGNWDQSNYGKNLYNRYSRADNIKLLSPIYNIEHLDYYRANAYCYLHGHSAGGTNPSLVEAMNLFLPIICFNVDFNRYTTHNQALYFSNADDLVNIVINVTKEELDVIKEKMYCIAVEYYSWDHICSQYENLLLNCNKTT